MGTEYTNGRSGDGALKRAAQSDVAAVLARIVSPTMLMMLVAIAGWSANYMVNATNTLAGRVGNIELKIAGIQGQQALASYIDQESAKDRQELKEEMKVLRRLIEQYLREHK